VVLSQAGNRKNAQTVIFGSQATMEFFASVPDLKGCRERLKREVRPRMPASYQVIVRCGVDLLLALHWNYETHRFISLSP
jgi:hypothetical protein